MKSYFIAMIFLMFIVGCGETWTPKYYPGTIIRIKITGQKAMVLGYYPYSRGLYLCRVRAAIANHQGGIITNPATTFTAYAKVQFREYELEPCQGEKK